VEYLELGDFLVIAEAVLGVRAETIVRFERVVPLAESALAAPRAGFGGVELYPEFEMKAAVLCSRLVRNHPLPDGNKRTGFLCLREFVARNGCDWHSPGTDETVDVIEAVAAGAVSESELSQWIRDRLH
jgi:death-on-curing protein